MTDVLDSKHSMPGNLALTYGSSMRPTKAFSDPSNRARESPLGRSATARGR